MIISISMTFLTLETGPFPFKKKINFSPHNFREKNKWSCLIFFLNSWKWRKDFVSLYMYLFFSLWIYSRLGSSAYVHCTLYIVKVLYRTGQKIKCAFLRYEISHNVNLCTFRVEMEVFRNKRPRSQVDSLSVPVRYLI